MSLKTKLISSLVSICLVIAMVTFGVLAAQSVNYSLNGVVFLADGVAATIYDASVANGHFVSGIDPATKMKDFSVVLTSKEEDFADEKKSWENLDLEFNENGDPTIISFRIRNDNKQSKLRVQAEVKTLNLNNAKIEVNNSNKTLDVNEYFKFEITFSILNPNFNVNIENFQILFTLSLVE